MTYKYNHINEVMKGELKDLAKGEHGETLKAWSYECVDAGYRKGLACGAAAAIIGTVITYFIKGMRGGLGERHTQRNIRRIVRQIDVTK
jgi:hypothetical protein